MSMVRPPRHPRAALHELTSIREAHVFKDAQLAGVLRRVPGGVEFGYLSEYLSAGGEQVATTLPLTDVPVLTPAGAVPPYFAGLLPEGRRLSSLRRAVKTSADDDLSLLLAVGSDTVGDVTILPVGEAPAEPLPLLVADRNFDHLSPSATCSTQPAWSTPWPSLASKTRCRRESCHCRCSRRGVDTSSSSTRSRRRTSSQTRTTSSGLLPLRAFLSSPRPLFTIGLAGPDFWSNASTA